jgi:hypothetical protein
MGQVGSYNALFTALQRNMHGSVQARCKYSAGVDTRSDAPTEYEN